MATFSTDADLLKWEPMLARDMALDHQCLQRGTGATSQGFLVTATGAHFMASHVRPGHAIHLGSAGQAVDGFFEVLSVESETQLMAGMIGARGDESVPLPAGTGLDFAIHTFDPQHEEARGVLLARFGLDVDAADPAADLQRWIAQCRCLRRASVAWVLTTIFRGQAADGPEAAGFARKADQYARLFEDEVAKVRLPLDRDGDGRPDTVQGRGSLRLRRE